MVRMHSPLLLRLIAVLLICCEFATAAPSLLVKTTDGLVMGKQNSPTHNVWLGIPFAAPPVGANRWKPPMPVKPWDNTLNTVQYGPVCAASGSGNNEDCLYLNVWAPVNLTKTLPVLVWMYGGGFISGNANGYSGEYLGGSDLIVVTLNYRLGALGFMYHPILMNGTSTSGFFGIQDQRAAFQWVQKNIAAFGGDPKRVAIAGESAGAISACIHIAAPRSAGLFSRAISESGFCNLHSIDQSMAYSNQVIQTLGCPANDLLNCLHSKTPAQLIAASPFPSWVPTLHPYELPAQPDVVIQQGKFNTVPVIAGFNHDEFSMYICPKHANINDAQYQQLLTSCYGSSLATQIYQFYPSSKYPNPTQALIAATSDATFICGTKKLDVGVTATGLASSYVYSFDHVTGDSCHGSQHSSELSYIWWGSGMTGKDKNLTQIMRDAWVTFAANAVPSLPVNVQWNAYDTTHEYVISFDYNTVVKEGFHHDACAFWDKLQSVTTQFTLLWQTFDCFM